MADRYYDLSALVLENIQGVDYEIRVVKRSREVVVAAIHGGGIEPLTGELARDIAGEDYSYYEFRGIRPANNAELHIDSRRFDELRLRGILNYARTAIGIHGTAGDEHVVYAGGNNRKLLAVVEERLQAAGFTVERATAPLAGRHPDNFINRPVDRGVQLELSWGLRDAMVKSWEAGGPKDYTPLYHAFVEAVRGAIQSYIERKRSSLEEIMAEFERVTALIPEEMKRGAHHGEGE